MKNYLGGFVFLLLAGLYSGVSAQNSLIVKQINGNLKGTALTSLSKITFAAGNMLVRKTDASIDSYLLSDVFNITFGIYSGVTEITTNSSLLTVFPNPATSCIQLKNLSEITANFICIYSLDGSRLIQKCMNSTSEPIDIRCLNKGMYLLSVNGSTLKFIKQ